MKNIFKLFFLFTVALFVSCTGSDDDTSFLNGRASVAYFVPGVSGTLFVREDSPSVFNVAVGVSEAKNYDRTFTVAVDENLSTAVEGGDYEALATSFVVPAGSIVGYVPVTGIFDGATLTGSALRLNLVEVQDSSLGARTTFTLTIVRLCPLEAAFTGNYVMSQLTPGLPAAGGAPAFAAGGTFALSVGSNELERKFTAKAYPAAGLANPATVFTFSLACGQSTAVGTYATGIGCTAGNPIVFTAGNSPASFDAADDSVIDVTFTEDTNGSCGVPQQTTIRLTKVN